MLLGAIHCTDEGKLARLQRKAKLLKIALRIHAKASNSGLEVKRIILGKKVKKELKVDGALLKKLASSSHLSRKLRRTTNKIAKLKNELKRKKLLAKKRQRKLNPFAKKEENKTDFKFEPNFGGMPYPPFLLNGPHFHPPMKIVINTLPYPNPRASNFYQIAQ